MSEEITFEIKKHIGVITEYHTGWRKELNIVSWNGGTAKFDIRDWDPTHTKLSRGITLHPSEAAALKELLNGIEVQDAY